MAEILSGALEEGELIPSVRQVAADLQVNPITVSKAYHQLEEEGIVEKRRGIGMQVCTGGQARLLQQERERFLREDWPALKARLMQLGFSVAELMEEKGERNERN